MPNLKNLKNGFLCIKEVQVPIRNKKRPSTNKGNDICTYCHQTPSPQKSKKGNLQSAGCKKYSKVYESCNLLNLEFHNSAVTCKKSSTK